jgi:hypothetical protein
MSAQCYFFFFVIDPMQHKNTTNNNVYLYPYNIYTTQLLGSNDRFQVNTNTCIEHFIHVYGLSKKLINAYMYPSARGCGDEGAALGTTVLRTRRWQRRSQATHGRAGGDGTMVGWRGGELARQRAGALDGMGTWLSEHFCRVPTILDLTIGKEDFTECHLTITRQRLF